jgi:hypothetical protein
MSSSLGLSGSHVPEPVAYLSTIVIVVSVTDATGTAGLADPLSEDRR